jgi:hypothetical protein
LVVLALVLVFKKYQSIFNRGLESTQKMTTETKVIPRFQKIINAAYDVEAALKQQGIKRKVLEKLRTRIKSSAILPFLTDAQVKI